LKPEMQSGNPEDPPVKPSQVQFCEKPQLNASPYPETTQVAAEVEQANTMEKKKRTFSEACKGICVFAPGLQGKSERAQFTIKVYALTLCMLGVTTAGIAAVFLSD